jgi:putative Mg2+ transporter-C (MgtC) family protein
MDFLINLGSALALGALIGIERQWRQRLAGLRTNTLVSTGSALFVLLSQLIETAGDQSRIASYVVSGVGFLGAGVIMKEGGSVRGLNTAATIWGSAAVGCLAGFGFHVLASFGTAAIVGIHLFLRPLAAFLNRQSLGQQEGEVHYQLRIICKDEVESQIRYLILQAVNASEIILQSIQSVDLNGGTQKVEITADLDCASKQDHLLEKIVGRISLEKGVTTVAWKNKKTINESI